MTVLFRAPSLGGVVHMTANGRTVNAKDIPAFTVSPGRKVNFTPCLINFYTSKRLLGSGGFIETKTPATTVPPVTLMKLQLKSPLF